MLSLLRPGFNLWPEPRPCFKLRGQRPPEITSSHQGIKFSLSVLLSTSQQHVPASILPVLTMPSSLGLWAAKLTAGSPSHSGCLFSVVLRPCAVRDPVLLSPYLCSTLGTSSEPCQPISWQHPPKRFSFHCVILRRRSRKVDTKRRLSKGKQIHKAKFSSPSN